MFVRHAILEVDSTNDWIKKRIESDQLLNNYLIYTLCQTKGRGQFTRVWNMIPGLDLAFSIYRKEDGKVNCYSPVHYVMTVCLVLKDTFGRLGVESKIKWPNDLLVENKKIAGVLIESITQNHITHTITGVGINLNSQRKHLRESYSSISIKDVLEGDVLPEDFLNEFEYQFEKWERRKSSENESYIQETYNKNLYKRGEFINLIETKNQNKIYAKITGVDTWGRLITEQSDGIKLYHHGEVKFCT